MGIAKAGYYSFEDLAGAHNGLVRVTDTDAGGTAFERVADGAWVADQSLARHFTDPGSSFLEPIDRATAEQLAKRYGVELASEVAPAQKRQAAARP